ncbi:MAG: excinuclease ABC subunit UvrC [Pseudobdellovibrionaceae bacterium]
MTDIFSQLKVQIKDYPSQSGVYLMKDLSDKIIYVGKAKNLKNRVRSYFSEAVDMHPKTKVLVAHIQHIEYIITRTEVEAFLLEASLIKKHKPKYNIRLRDDKSYPYIQLTWGDEFPRLYLKRKVKKDGSLYFGPYTSGGAVFGTIRFLNKIFKIRDCTDSVFKSRTRPCMTHQIGRCTAPCVNLISQADYKAEVDGAKLFLRGQNRQVVKVLTQKMQQAAEEEKFEVAARLRDSAQAIKAILEKQAVINDSSGKDQDVIGYFGDERGCLVQTLHVRQGRVIGLRQHFLPQLNPKDSFEDPREWLADFLNQYYDDNIVPDEVLTPVDLGKDICELLKKVLLERSDHTCTVRFATDNKGLNLLEMAQKNAEQNFLKYVSKSEEKLRGLDEIQEKFNLPRRPSRIECYDISTFQGAETVASQVVFEDGVPAREHYRRYKIKTVVGIDDFASMAEVLSRRLQHQEYSKPDLILIDGGKGQLAAVQKILQDLNYTDVPLVGLAKARTENNFSAASVQSTEERFFLPGRQNPVTFRSNSDALHILVGLRDEAHRFAITYHRKLREATSIESELDMVIGLGEKRKKELLKKFDSVDALRLADPEEIAQIKGFNRVLAERILLQLNEENSD